QADTRAEQLSAISELGALLGGFALVSIINVNVPENIDLDLLWVYGVVSAITICCMVISLIMCAILLLAVTRYSAHELEYDVRKMKDEEIDFESPFHIWWLKKCETDWSLGYFLFRTGVSLFLIELGIVSWVQYNLYQTTSISISVVAGLGILIWQFRILSRWRYLMKLPPIEINGPIDTRRMYSGRAQGISTVESVVSTFLGSYEVQNFQMWRLDDVEYTKQQIQWREDDIRRRLAWRLEDIKRTRRIQKLANERAIIDSRTEQLAVIAHLAVFMGFLTREAYSEAKLPNDANPTLIAFQGISAALGEFCTVLSMAIMVLIQMAVSRFASEELEGLLHQVKLEDLDYESPFMSWWLLRCEKEWILGLVFFRASIVFIVITLSILSWIRFNMNIGACIGITTLSAITLLYWYCRLQPRWHNVHKSH
ncbi:hypothetical protein THRCLA_10342, partial [Thraustotheca clavata]